MSEIVKLNNQNCNKCPFKQLEIVSINPVIKMCNKCNNNEWR